MEEGQGVNQGTGSEVVEVPMIHTMWCRMTKDCHYQDKEKGNLQNKYGVTRKYSTTAVD